MDDLDIFDWFRPHHATFHIDHIPPRLIHLLQGATMTGPEQPRELDEQGHQLANLAEGDPGNTDPEELTAPLDPADDVFDLLGSGQPKTAPADGA